MNPEIIPILNTQIDWNTYLVTAKQAFGYSISQELDNNRMLPDNLASLLVTLANIACPGVNPQSVFDEPGQTLQHIHLGFLVIANRECIYDIIQISKLNVINKESIIRYTELSVVSGNLEQWRNAIINGCSEFVSFDYRLFCDKCLLYFEKTGLGQIFNKYRRVGLQDKTFKLELK